MGVSPRSSIGGSPDNFAFTGNFPVLRYTVIGLGSASWGQRPQTLR